MMDIEPYHLAADLAPNPCEILAGLAVSRRSLFESIAAAWLESGAGFFGVWGNDTLLCGWPAGRDLPVPDLSAALQATGRPIGRIGLQGPVADAWQARLRNEAELISAWVQAESDSSIITTDLCVSQDQQLAFYELSHSMRKYRSLPQIVEALAQQATRLTGAICGFLWLDVPKEINSGKELSLRAAAGLPGPDSRQESALFEQLRQTGKATLLTGSNLPVPPPTPIQVLYLLPIRFQGKLISALGLGFDRPAAEISPVLKLSKAIADQAEAYIENALLHSEALQQAKLRTEMELAQQIQVQLLPEKIPAVTGIDVAAHMRPAYEVGGDFYDFVSAQEEGLFFVLGDTAGKGVPAALLMSMSLTVFHSAARFISDATPQTLLERALSNLYDDYTRTGLFVTAFAGKYSPGDHSLVYANAGHSPVIYRPAGGSARILEADAPPLGVLPVSLSANHSLACNPGDILIVATDGFNEASQPNGEMFGYERLLQMIDDVASGSAADILEACYARIDEFCHGHPQEDDQTLIVIKGY